MKILHLLLAALTTLAISVPAFADDPPVCEEGQTENCVLLE